MESVLEDLHFESVVPWLKATLFLLLAFGLARIGKGIARQVTTDRLSAQHVMIAQRLGYWLILILGFVSAMREVGFDLSVLLGAAGILTVAVGFAAQTSASNLISGLFLLGERPFVVGDVIRVGATTGEVVAIDLLSVKLRTFDNLLVRVPNESLLKAEITNLTHFRIRRVDIPLIVDHSVKLPTVRALLIGVAEAEPSILDEPRPTVMFTAFRESGVEVQLSAWATREGWADAKNQLAERVKAAIDRDGIALPARFPPAVPGPRAQDPVVARIGNG